MEENNAIKRGELLEKIKGLVDKTFPNDIHQQGLTYSILHKNHELKEWE